MYVWFGIATLPTAKLIQTQNQGVECELIKVEWKPNFDPRSRQSCRPFITDKIFLLTCDEIQAPNAVLKFLLTYDEM